MMCHLGTVIAVGKVTGFSGRIGPPPQPELRCRWLLIRAGGRLADGTVAHRQAQADKAHWQPDRLRPNRSTTQIGDMVFLPL